MSPSRLLSLVRVLVWRPQRRDALRCLMTVLGVALGISVILAIRLANDGVLAAFRKSLDHVAGKTQLEVSAGDAGFDESLFPTIAGVPGVASAAPIIQSLVPVAGHGSETLLVLGVDVLSDAAFRDYRGPAPEITDPLRLLTDSDAILLTADYAQLHGMTIGSHLFLMTPTGRKPFIVRGLLADDGLARAMDGRIAVLDIAAAQVHLGKLGRLDRVDVLLRPGVDPDRVAADLARRLPPQVVVERPEQRNRQVEQMLGAFQLNLFALSLIALFVGAFLVYNTMFVSVVRRRRHIGILRTLGMTRAGIVGMVMSEGAAIGLVGSLVGVGLGVLLARWTLRAVSLTVSALYAFIIPGELEVSRATLLEAVALGLVVAVLASVAPALEAARVTPRDQLASAALERRHRQWLYAGVGTTLLGAAAALAQLRPVGGRPLFGYAAAGALLLGAVFFCPLILQALHRGLGTALRGARLISARLAAGNVGRALRKNSITTAAMAVGLALLVSVSTMIASFRHTVEVWIDQTIRADLYVSRTGRLIRGADARLPEDLLTRIRGVAGVADADGIRSLHVRDEQGLSFVVNASDLGLVARRGRLLFRHGDSGQILLQAQARGEVVVSETFAELRHLKEGDQVTLRAPSRVVRLRIAGVYYDYTTEGGAVVMDRGLFHALWADPWLTSIAVYLAPGADAESAKESIRRAAVRDDVLLLSNRDLRSRILEIFDQTFAITYALQAIALIIAALGIFTTLIASVLERTAEIGILRSLGFEASRVRRTVLTEAGLLGVAANVVGISAGIGLSLILIYVINKQSFGWTIQLVVPGMRLIEYATLSVGVSLLAGLYPAWRASRLRVADAVRYE